MPRIGGCGGRGLGRLAAGLVSAGFVVMVVVAVVVAPAGPAAAHARLVGSSPEGGTTVDRAPDEVVIELDAKPATIEGDPLQVYTPEGRRVDAGDPHVGDQGRRLAVALDPGQPLPSGEYQVAYRVVSADSHVITGRLSFTVRLATPARDAAGAGRTGVPVRGVTTAAADPAAGSHHLIAGAPPDLRPRLVAAGALALAVLALLLRVLRVLRRRPTPRVAPTGDRSPPRHHRERHGPAARRVAEHRRPRPTPRTAPSHADKSFQMDRPRRRVRLRTPEEIFWGDPAVPVGHDRTPDAVFREAPAMRRSRRRTPEDVLRADLAASRGHARAPEDVVREGPAVGRSLARAPEDVVREGPAVSRGHLRTAEEVFWGDPAVGGGLDRAPEAALRGGATVGRGHGRVLGEGGWGDPGWGSGQGWGLEGDVSGLAEGSGGGPWGAADEDGWWP